MLNKLSPDLGESFNFSSVLMQSLQLPPNFKFSPVFGCLHQMPPCRKEQASSLPSPLHSKSYSKSTECPQEKNGFTMGASLHPGVRVTCGNSVKQHHSTAKPHNSPDKMSACVLACACFIDHVQDGKNAHKSKILPAICAC